MAMPARELAAGFEGTEIMEFTAKARFMRVSPQKARLVLDLIKGLRVEQALNTLAFTNKRVAPLVHKLLRSAIENANYMNRRRASRWTSTVCLSSAPSPTKARA